MPFLFFHDLFLMDEFLHYIAPFSRSWPSICWSSRQLLECLSHQLPSPHFLLVAITETALFKGLFPLMWSGRLLAHLMRRWQLFLEPLPHCTPMRVLLYSSFLMGALWGLPLMVCHSSLLGFGIPRTGSSSAISLNHLDFCCMSSATSLLGMGLGP